MIHQRRDWVETNADLLLQARWLLDRAHLRFNILADSTGAQQINRIINTIETERQRWLRAVDSPSPKHTSTLDSFFLICPLYTPAGGGLPDNPTPSFSLHDTELFERPSWNVNFISRHTINDTANMITRCHHTS
jgi:hypothetical protein